MKTVQSKQTTPRRFSSATVVLAAMLASGILASCTKGEEQSTTDSSLIALNAAMGTTNGELNAQNSAQTKAPINGDPTVDVPALTLYFARTDEASDNTYPDYGATALSATRAAGKGATAVKITWAAGSKQYYQESGRKTKLTGWYPGGATAKGDASGNGYYDGATRTVSWTIDGQQDVMTASALEGSSSSPLPSVAMEHRLSQVQVYLYAEDAQAAAAWGNTKEVLVREQHSSLLYDLKANAATGIVRGEGNANTDFEIYKDASGIAAPTTKASAALLGKVMIEPQGESYILKLSIVTVGGGTQSVSLAPQKFESSKAYKVYLKLKEFTISTSATITDWANPTDQDMNIEGGGWESLSAMYYGDAANNGGITTDLQGSTTSSYNSLTIGSNGSKYGSAAEAYGGEKPYYKLEVAPTDEKNSDGSVMNWETAYNSCKSKTDFGGGWRLPRLSEMRLMYLNKSSLEETPGFTAFLASGNFWSSTEYSSNSSNAWYVTFSNGNAVNDAKSLTLYVRCVREI